MVAVRVKSGVPPTDYSKCNQTVTIYHSDGQNYTKTIIDHAFFDFRKNQNANRVGISESNSFLLVIPYFASNTQPVFNGDKVLLGVGEDITTREEWAALIPSKVANLAVVKYVDPKYWNNAIAHWEAGG